MYKSIKIIREELEKDDISTIDINRCLDMISDIDDKINELEDENLGYNDEIYSLENEVYDLKEQIVWNKKTSPKTLDDEFKEEIFEELSKKYHHSKLENLLKTNGIL